MTFRLPWAVAVTSLVGAAVFFALGPWGDPCSVATSSEGLCSDVPSASRLQLANVVFVLICLLIGFAAGSIAESRRYIAGIVSAPLSAMLGGFTGHYLYGMKGPWFHADFQGAYFAAGLFIGCVAMLGLVGASASRWTIRKRWGNA
jgi:hypothetical protein